MVSGHVLLFAVTLLWPAIEIAPSAVRSETAVAAGAPRVRALDELAAELLADGRRRSETLTQLLTTLQRTNVIVPTSSTSAISPAVPVTLVVSAVRLYLISDFRYSAAVESLLASPAGPPGTTFVLAEGTHDAALADLVESEFAGARIAYESATVTVKRHAWLTARLAQRPGGPGLVASDGLVEALEWADPEGRGFLLGVQWHPERMTRSSPLSLPLRDRFLQEARKYAQNKIK